MNLLFIGQFYPRKIAETIAEDTFGKVGFSNHNFELSLIKGFSGINGVNIRVISSPQVYSYPHNNKHFFIKKESYNDSGVPVRSTSFVNISGITLLSKPLCLALAILKELRKFNGDEVNVIVNPHSLNLLQGIALAKRLTKKKLQTTLIVPDVPACMMEMDNKNGLKSKLVGLLTRYNASLARKFDKYVFLTAAMNDYYKTSQENFMVMEGLIDPDRALKPSITETFEKNIILYTGTLRRIFGVMDLVEAFEKGKFKNAELWICGSGECAGEIENKAKSNPSIKFYGLVSSEKALELQSKATILTNPRSASGNYTKYSFPSKTIEYLLAGKIVVMNRLPGIPKEYDDYLVYPINEGTSAWIHALNEVLSLSVEERRCRGAANRKFILSRKIAEYQCQRIIDFIKP